jgi:Neuraminidase (sialidase)
MLSDDNGKTWRLSADSNFGGEHWPNEVQAVELSDGHVVFFSRSLLSRRLRTESYDGGEHWGSSEVLETLPETRAEGCEGSTIACRSNPDHLVYSGPTSPWLYREKMAIMTSTDKGHTWSFHKLIDQGSSAYSSLAWHGSTLGILYERSKDLRIIFEPDYISFAAIEDPCAKMIVNDTTPTILI